MSAVARRHLVTVHVIATIALIGADLTLVLLGVTGLGGTDPANVYPAAHRVAQWLAAPLAVASLLTGLAVLSLSPWSVRRDTWVQLKFATTVALTVLLLAVVIPWLGDAADTALAHGEVEISLRRRIAIAPAAASLLLIGNVVLGRYKPCRRRTSPVTVAA